MLLFTRDYSTHKLHPVCLPCFCFNLPFPFPGFPPLFLYPACNISEELESADFFPLIRYLLEEDLFCLRRVTLLSPAVLFGTVGIFLAPLGINTHFSGVVELVLFFLHEWLFSLSQLMLDNSHKSCFNDIKWSCLVILIVFWPILYKVGRTQGWRSHFVLSAAIAITCSSSKCSFFHFYTTLEHRSTSGPVGVQSLAFFFFCYFSYFFSSSTVLLQLWILVPLSVCIDSSSISCPVWTCNASQWGTFVVSGSNRTNILAGMQHLSQPVLISIYLALK